MELYLVTKSGSGNPFLGSLSCYQKAFAILRKMQNETDMPFLIGLTGKKAQRLTTCFIEILEKPARALRRCGE